MKEYESSNNDKLMEEIASEVIVGICQLLPKSYDLTHIHVATTCQVPKRYGLFCGSSAEFYIRPLHPLIDDLDSLSWPANRLAFVEHFPMLPHDVSRFRDT